MAEKANPNVPKAPLQPIPVAEEPFSRLIIDCVGPIPKTTKGNQYVFSIMCATSIPLRNIYAKKIVGAPTNFFYEV